MSADDDPLAPLRAGVFAKIAIDIAGQHGMSLIGVAGDGKPSFTYTIGLTDTPLGHEIVVIGLPPHFAGHILNDIADTVRTVDGARSIVVDTPDDRWANLPCVFKYATAPATHRDYCCVAAAYYGRDVPVLQMVMPDRDGLFPWDAGYDRAYMGHRQPELWS